MTGDFLSRWSRRKAEARTAPEPAAAATPAAEPPHPLLDESISAELRHLALRKLWSSDPTFAAIDPLDMHNMDYAAAAGNVMVELGRFGKDLIESHGNRDCQPLPRGVASDDKVAEQSCLEKNEEEAS